MPTVHAQRPKTTNRTTTGRGGRETSPQIACSDCGGHNDCVCLDPIRLVYEMAPLVRRLLEGGFDDCEVVDRLALLVERNDQRRREWDAYPEIGDAEDNQSDRVLIEDLVSQWDLEPSFKRTVEGVAELRKVPVERVRALLDQFLADSRPEPTAPAQIVPHWCKRCRQLEGAARRLLVDGADPAKGSRTRERHRAEARKRMRAILDLPASSHAPLSSHEAEMLRTHGDCAIRWSDSFLDTVAELWGVSVEYVRNFRELARQALAPQVANRRAA